MGTCLMCVCALGLSNSCCVSRDRSIILETDADVVMTRVQMKKEGGDGRMSLAETTMSQMLQGARDSITKSLLR